VENKKRKVLILVLLHGNISLKRDMDTNNRMHISIFHKCVRQDYELKNNIFAFQKLSEISFNM
jgi:hypothetical protein